MTEDQFQKEKLSRFATKHFMNKDELEKRTNEVKQSFYNRLESKKLIKKLGRIPFMEHMSMTHKNPTQISE